MIKPDLVPIIIARLLEETKGPLFYVRKNDGNFLLGWGAKEMAFAPPESSEGLWVGGKSFFAGFSMGNLHPTKLNSWKDFPESFFFKPRLILKGNFSKGNADFESEDSTEQEDKAWENFLTDTSERTEEIRAWEKKIPELQSIIAPHAKREWQGYCDQIQSAISRGELQKVVPARKKTYLSADNLSYGAIFLKLANNAERGSNVYVLRHNEDVFLGASPEHLLEAKIFEDQFVLDSPAIAGTRPRSANKISDQKLAEELINSKKEKLEHQIVVDFLVDKLSSVGTLIETAKAEVLKLDRLQHIFKKISVKLKNFSRVRSLLDHLHPTPAVGGLPQAGAMELIAKHELWDRGYFASPIGYFWQAKSEASFLVGIRGLLLSKNKVHVFAGAGYVDGSDSETEWDETSKKMESILANFDIKVIDE